jgi:peptidoglycan hydrolase-like protein with peptidoglycan-binding domain
MAISPTMGVKQTIASEMALKQAKLFGLTLTSAYRSPSHDRQVGGSGTGDHTQGEAYDFAGAYSAMERFADWAHGSGMFTQVIFKDRDYRTGRYIGGHQDHVHVAWNGSGAKPGPSGGGDDLVKKGDEGSLVFAIQGLLGTMFHDLKADGKFGPQTDSAVREFQKKMKLKVDGIVGKNTWGKMTGLFF